MEYNRLPRRAVYNGAVSYYILLIILIRLTTHNISLLIIVLQWQLFKAIQISPTASVIVHLVYRSSLVYKWLQRHF